jgi:hypothetical protein
MDRDFREYSSYRSTLAPPKGWDGFHPSWVLRFARKALSFNAMKRSPLATSGRAAGIGIFLLRSVLAGQLLFTRLCPCADHDFALLRGACIVSGVCLIAGFLTSTSATLAALLSIASLFLCHTELEVQIGIVASIMSVAVALLGGGVISLDARLFGRRRVVFPPQSDDQ